MDMYSTVGLYGWIVIMGKVSYRARLHFHILFIHSRTKSTLVIMIASRMLCLAFSAMINCTVHGMNGLFDCLRMCLCMRVLPIQKRANHSFIIRCKIKSSFYASLMLAPRCFSLPRSCSRQLCSVWRQWNICSDSTCSIDFEWWWVRVFCDFFLFFWFE